MWITCLQSFLHFYWSLSRRNLFLSVFILTEELPLTFLICLMVVITLIFCFSEKKFSFHFWIIFSLYRTLGQLSVLSIFTDDTPLSSSLHSFRWKVCCYFCVCAFMNFLLSLAAVKSFLLFKGQSWPLPFQYFFSSALSSLFWYPSYTYIRDVMLSHSLCMLLF